jgi:hypothetical protein
VLEREQHWRAALGARRGQAAAAVDAGAAAGRGDLPRGANACHSKPLRAICA